MTDQDMFEGWVPMLAPLFSGRAQFDFKPRRRLICVHWMQDDEPGRPGRERAMVSVAFTQMAWKAYRGARSARRARADLNLIALIRPWAELYVGEDPADVRIPVAWIDLFPLLESPRRSTEFVLPAL